MIRNFTNLTCKISHTPCRIAGLQPRYAKPHKRLMHYLGSKSDDEINHWKSLLKGNKEKIEQLSNSFCDYNYLQEILNTKESNNKYQSFVYDICLKKQFHKPYIDMEYILTNQEFIQQNLKRRRETKNRVLSNVLPNMIEIHKSLKLIIREIRNLRNKLKDAENLRQSEIESLGSEIKFYKFIYTEMEKIFYFFAMKLPNSNHDKVPEEPQVIKHVNPKQEMNFKVLDHHLVGKNLGMIREDHLTQISGRRTYYLTGALADLEQALIRYTMDKLISKGFQLMSGPSILHGGLYEACGISTSKNILYSIDPSQYKDYFLSGTSEVSIAAYFANHALRPEQLPLKVCSLSTCNRKETDTRKDRRGIYRVHHFNKVEMFGITENHTGIESAELFEEFLRIQEEIFSDLNLHFRLVEMPPHELGLAAHRKVDMESWMPGRGEYGEISSTSNCTDFQAKRLHILTKRDNKYTFAHTLNGTACAVPRLIISIIEQFQRKNKTVEFPDALKPYLYGESYIRKIKSNNLEYIGPANLRFSPRNIK